MSYARTQDYAEGNVLMACSICGVAYLFPEEISRGSDNLFRCKRTCHEQPIRERDRIIAESHKRREMPPPKFGIAPSWTPRVVSGAGGVIVGDFSAGHGGISTPLLTFTADDIGKTIAVNGSAHVENQASFFITQVFDANTVIVDPMLADETLTSDMTITLSL